MPIVLISIPSLASQACSVEPVSISGSPEANPSNRIAVMRLSASACISVGLAGSDKGSELEVVVHDQRRMIGELLVLEDMRLKDPATHGGGSNLVIDSPA